MAEYHGFTEGVQHGLSMVQLFNHQGLAINKMMGRSWWINFQSNHLLQNLLESEVSMILPTH